MAWHDRIVDGMIGSCLVPCIVQCYCTVIMYHSVSCTAIMYHCHVLLSCIIQCHVLLSCIVQYSMCFTVIHVIILYHCLVSFTYTYSLYLSHSLTSNQIPITRIEHFILSLLAQRHLATHAPDDFSDPRRGNPTGPIVPPAHTLLTGAGIINGLRGRWRATDQQDQAWEKLLLVTTKSESGHVAAVSRALEEAVAHKLRARVNEAVRVMMRAMPGREEQNNEESDVIGQSQIEENDVIGQSDHVDHVDIEAETADVSFEQLDVSTVNDDDKEMSQSVHETELSSTVPSTTTTSTTTTTVPSTTTTAPATGAIEVEKGSSVAENAKEKEVQPMATLKESVAGGDAPLTLGDLSAHLGSVVEADVVEDDVHEEAIEAGEDVKEEETVADEEEVTQEEEVQEEEAQEEVQEEVQGEVQEEAVQEEVHDEQVVQEEVTHDDTHEDTHEDTHDDTHVTHEHTHDAYVTHESDAAHTKQEAPDAADVDHEPSSSSTSSLSSITPPSRLLGLSGLFSHPPASSLSASLLPSFAPPLSFSTTTTFDAAERTLAWPDSNDTMLADQSPSSIADVNDDVNDDVIDDDALGMFDGSFTLSPERDDLIGALESGVSPVGVSRRSDMLRRSMRESALFDSLSAGNDVADVKEERNE